MELLKPIQVGRFTLKNRIMFPPLTTGYESRDGSITAQSEAFYTRLAKGGTGYIVLGDVSPVVSFSPTPRLYKDEQIEGFARLAQAVHAYDTKLAVQIFHPEYDVQALTELFQQGDMAGVRQKMHHDMLNFTTEVSKERLMEIIDAVCECAGRAQKAGVDFVQIHGDRLTGCLCSPTLNHRTDEFGGSFENRTRFAVMMTKALRKAVPDMGIDYKLSVVTPERGKGGIPESEAVEFARLLQQSGVDMFHVAQANHTGNLADTIPPMGVQPYGFFVDIGARIKAAVSVPVSAVGRIINPGMAESLLANGRADIIAIGRPLLADPDWGQKLEHGGSIRCCVMCNKGCTDSIQNRAFLSCILNAENGYEESRQIVRAEQPKKVVIVGGGPAGLEAARVAALRGHTVTLFEKSAALGGQINLASVPPRKSEMRRAIQYLTDEVIRLGVELRMGVETDSRMVLSTKADAVLIATGSSNFLPPIDGKDRPHVCDAWNILNGSEQVFGHVAVIGGGLVGCETAEYLALIEGCQVSVIEMLPAIAAEESTTVTPTLFENFSKCGVKQYPKHKVLKITETEVICVDEEEKEVRIPVDFVVMAAGAKVNAFDASGLEAAGIPVVRIGDCRDKPSDIGNAIRDGYDAACAL